MAPTLVKSLSRLSSSSLIDLCLQWLNMPDHCTPYLQSNRSLNECEEEDYLFPPAESVGELRKIYLDLRATHADKSHVIDRILDGDWRRGLSLEQLAMLDFAVLEQSDSALRWSALKITRLANDEALPKGIEERSTKRRKFNNHNKTTSVTTTSTSSSSSASTPSTPSPATLPCIQPSTFVAALKSHISPLVKAHYHLHRLPAPYNLSIVRIYISSRAAFGPTAGNIPRSARHATDASRVIYIALPESCPYLYLSMANALASSSKDKAAKKGSALYAPMDLPAMKRCILESIPKAFSRPHERWALEATKLTAKSLKAVCALRGNSRPGTAGGAYSQFSTDSNGALQCHQNTDDNDNHHTKDNAGANIVPDTVTARFGAMADTHCHQQHHKQPQKQQKEQNQKVCLQHAPLDRFHVRINHLLRSPHHARSSANAAPIGLSFAGANVFLGLKQLASLDDGKYVDLERLPSWMTGEMGVSVMTV